MGRLKDQDWSNMTNRDIAEAISRMRPRMWFRVRMRFTGWLYQRSYRYRRHCTIHHCTSAPESKPSKPLTLDDIRAMLEKFKLKEE